LDKINQEWIGWIGDVIILHEGFKPNQVFGRNFAYKNVFIDDFDGGIAKFIQVKIEKVEGFNLFGK
jgi:tRNA A37 methylthiotransferase MiaB